MALNKFLFSTDENIDYLQSSLNSYAKGSKKAANSLDNFANDMFKKAGSQPILYNNPGGATSIALAPVGQALLGGLSWLGSATAGGVGWVLEALNKIPPRILFQEMYLNPDKFDMSYTIPVSKVETAGGVIINPWRPELPVVQMSGIVGWLRDESMLNSAINNAAKALVGGGGISGAASAFTNSFSAFGGRISNLGALQRFRENARKLSNSPRKFLENLRAMVLSPMYYMTTVGNTRIEKFNSKRIVAFTKQYPDGATFEGYFTKFDIQESGKDPETLRYNLEFVVLNISPISLQERLGQFIAPFYGTALELGNITGNVFNNITRF
jgi:hypothetical protein